MIKKSIIAKFRVKPGSKVRLRNFPTDWTGTPEARKLGKETIKRRAREILDSNRDQLTEAQRVLYANDTYALLLIFQALDAAGKDGTIRHVMSGVNPQGCQVFSFKRPSAEELDHHFLWRYAKRAPERGRIGIFNRSYYEEVLVVRVHPEILESQKLPPGNRGKRFWEARYRDINNFEQHLSENGTVILKFFLHLSKDEQKRRFLERLDNPEKHWKFSPADIAERSFWDQYRKAFEDALTATSTPRAPWYIIPADRKYVARAMVADIVTSAISDLKLTYPRVSKKDQRTLQAARKKLEAEK
ncbi:MAG: polyphosphate kinase 2 family protein [Ignavibacteria bacterium]|nr:polyphosphate kinase 2 family protein [Ignavibacteria bacterium]